MSSSQIAVYVFNSYRLDRPMRADSKKARDVVYLMLVLTAALLVTTFSTIARATDPGDAEAGKIESPGNPELESINASEPPASDDTQLFIQRPQWELGVGGGYFSGFDYPASNDENNRAIALPFFIYRSPLVRFGGGGIRAVAIENPRVKLDLSVGGSLNSSSEGNSVRQGMPDLDFLFEFGPQLEVRLFDHFLESGARWRGRFTSELRAVLSTDFKSLDAQGFVAEIGLGFNLNNVAGSSVSLISAVDVTFADERLQDYFYEVGTEFVTATRPEFDAQAGYLETNLFAALAMQALPRVRVFVGVSQGYFDGAANQDSPLFETTQQTRFLLGVVWTIKKSTNMIDIIEMGARN